MITEFGGYSLPSGTNAPPATIEPAPITAPSMIVALMPIKHESPIVAPWIVQWWVIEQKSPIIVGVSEPTWIIEKSWMLVIRPISMWCISARMTTCGQTDEPSPIASLPNK